MALTNNPWKVISEKQVYENDWIRVIEYEVINPGGGPGIYGKVHFRHLAVGILPLDDEGNIYLVGQFRFPLNEFSWEIPEGGGGEDESPLESAKRELLEETGLIADHWTELLIMHLSNSVYNEKAIVFLARNLKQRNPSPEETEQLIIRKMPFEHAFRMVEEGRITDSISVAAIQKIKLMMIDGAIQINGQ